MNETVARRLTKALWGGCFLLVLWLVLSVPPGSAECSDNPGLCETR